MKSRLIASLIAFLLAAGLNAQTVITQYGPVTGQTEGGVHTFLGIPFAAPPVGHLRWRPTTAPNSWTQPILANQYPPKCPQKQFTQSDTTGVIVGSEDCLYLNIWSPNLASSLPVMVFIHGGGNQGGSSSESVLGAEIYEGLNMAQRGNIVIVTLQYRVGPLGYLVHPGLEAESGQGISGNYGVLDQLFALQWVQNNIAQFGGDPSNVTIFGESAGGVNVGNLLTSPLAVGLFHKAIIQSGVPGIELRATASQSGQAFVNEFIATGTDAEKLAYLRTLSADSLVATEEHPIQQGIVQQAWRPSLDFHVFQGLPEAVFQSGNFNSVPLIIGSNADEMSLSAPPTVYPFMVTALLNGYLPPAGVQQALALYPPGTTTTTARTAYVDILTDAQFTNSVRRTASCVSKNQTEPVWRYFFSHTHNPTIPGIGGLGAYHGIELLYVFNTWENVPIATGPLFTADDERVEDYCVRYWSNFAYTGNPNSDGLPNWPIYDADTDCYLEIKGSPNGAQCGLRTEKCDFWDAATGYTGCTTSTSVENFEPHPTIEFYPNPTSGVIHIESAEGSFQQQYVSVFNSTGERVLQMRGTQTIDLGSYPPGLYLLVVRDGRTAIVKKVVRVQ